MNIKKEFSSLMDDIETLKSRALRVAKGALSEILRDELQSKPVRPLWSQVWIKNSALSEGGPAIVGVVFPYGPDGRQDGPITHIFVSLYQEDGEDLVVPLGSMTLKIQGVSATVEDAMTKIGFIRCKNKALFAQCVADSADLFTGYVSLE